MSIDNATPKSRRANIKNYWVIALLISVAINGLLGGVLLSKHNHQTERPNISSRQDVFKAVPNNPRHFLRSLSPERRKQVMTTAIQNLQADGRARPRKLFKKLRQEKRKTMRLLRAEEIDIKAVEQSLANIRALNQKLAISGDALMIEVLAQLTTEERKAAGQALLNRKSKRRQAQKPQ